jgi:hypothetical protein
MNEYLEPRKSYLTCKEKCHLVRIIMTGTSAVSKVVVVTDLVL